MTQLQGGHGASDVQETMGRPQDGPLPVLFGLWSYWGSLIGWVLKCYDFGVYESGFVDGLGGLGLVHGGLGGVWMGLEWRFGWVWGDFGGGVTGGSPRMIFWFEGLTRDWVWVLGLFGGGDWDRVEVEVGSWRLVRLVWSSFYGFLLGFGT